MKYQTIINPMRKKIVFLTTKYGGMKIVYDNKGISRIYFPSPRFLRNETISKALLKLQRDFQRYFNGQNVKFKCKLNYEGLSNFERKVLKCLKTIPYGQTRSYSWVAEKIGNPKAYRAIGNAVGKNPFPIIVPCHRVILNNGKLGGFSCGIGWKKKLLKICEHVL